MKTVIVGANHAGIAAAKVLLDHEDQEVIMIERGSSLSYLGSGSALWVGRLIDSYEGLFYAKPEDFEAKGATVHMETTVDSIDFDQKVVHATQSSGNTLEISYDKLILATGSVPISPNVPGNDLDGIHFLKKFEESVAVDKELDNPDVKRVAIIGAGYIGVEIAEATRHRGKEVIVFDAADTSLSTYYDYPFSTLMDKNLSDNGLELHYSELATGYEGTNGRVNKLITNKGEYDVDLVINAIGFLPNNTLGKDHLELFKNGAYLVNRHQQTSDPDVYAIGDCATIYSTALREPFYIALASNAMRGGYIAGHNIVGDDIESPGVQGSNAIQIFGYNMVSTGFSVKSCERFGLDVSYVDYEDTQKGDYMTNNALVKIRIVYETSSRRILGAQIASTDDISMAIHLFSLAIAKEVTIDDLKLLDLFFLPHLNQPYNYITMAARLAS